MRGRYPSGPEFVEQLPGSRLAKERARVLLETVAGKRRVQEACVLLGISEPRFDQLRIHGLEHLVQSMEPRLAGRPPRTPTLAEERVRELEVEVAALRMQVKIAQTRAEIALVLPNAVHESSADSADGTTDTPDQVGEKRANSAGTNSAGTNSAGTNSAGSAAEKKTNQQRRSRRQRRRRPPTRAPASRKPT